MKSLDWILFWIKVNEHTSESKAVRFIQIIKTLQMHVKITWKEGIQGFSYLWSWCFEGGFFSSLKKKSSVFKIIPREGRKRWEVIQRDRALNLIAQKSKQQKNQHQDNKNVTLT